ncbi:PREDICTED: solute carrier family 22 member 5-like [Diuraphis noxia]|uniref:solute carrier family 22 member 5-like n=1 Tax=Diuraphis noxia TaxID=143948 RepID=UPI0007638C14|nr:PREDICTED: solute carrier family 22 member 5-like [Diuraphis noxia]
MDLDEILGNFGLGSYQVTVCTLMGLVLMYSNISPLSYAITASDLKYRCEIPICDADNPSYNPDWLNLAIPFNEKSNEHYKCLMYHHVSRTVNMTNISANSTSCKRESFNVNSKKKCNKWVFGETERTIVNDFGIMCEENKWKLNMVGTVNSIGQVIGIPLAGYISDRSGRKYVSIIGSVASATLGTLKSFSANYYSFLFFELFESMASSGVYAATFVLGIELVSLKSRAAVSTLMGCFYPMGAVIMGFIAYMILDWRIMLRIVNLPGLFILGYIWYVPESLRFLQTKNRIEEMAMVLTKIAESNGKTLPSCVQEALVANNLSNATNSLKKEEISICKLLKKIFNSKDILLRVIICSFSWMTITLVYYGLSLTSVELSGNKYLNFMLVNVVEVPAFLTSWYFMEQFSRRYTQAFSFFLSGIGCIMVNLISTDYLWMQLLLFLSSKYAITMAFNNMYIFTAEMFPTEMRMSLIGIVSMFGRLGLLFAPQMTLLGAYFGQYIPILLFGIISTMAGAMSFLFPETKDQKLPDTVKQVKSVEEVN